MLTIENIEVVYHHTVQALRGLSLEAPEGKIVALLGSNGAGKTTTLKAATRLVELENGRVREGRILFKGKPVERFSPDALVHEGLFHIREGRRIFTELTVEENLIAASNALRTRDLKPAYDRVYDFFPRLKERRKSQAGYTSGGEQQMVAMGRALMSRPETILLDEPSMGLAPQLVEQIFEIVKSVNEKEGVTFLLAEQNTNVALRYAHYGYILESGRVVMGGPAAELREKPDVKEFYLGMSDDGRKSFRDVRSYRRRKRWLS